MEAVAINNWVSATETETLGKAQFKKKISNSLMVTLILQVELLYSKCCFIKIIFKSFAIISSSMNILFNF